MAISIDYDHASERLNALFDTAETSLLAGEPRPQVLEIEAELDIIFSSNTQAFREALLGCFLAKLHDRAVDVHKPYVSQGDNAFNGRTLDERVVNPTLQQRRIPSSRGPFLSVFRRSVEFTATTRDGVRDKPGYDTFLQVLSFIDNLPDDDNSLTQATYAVVYRFVELREASNVPLTRIQRMSVGQIASLVSRLLDTPSGGRLPMFIVVAVLCAANEHLELDWEIQWEGINVADAASGLGGDIVVSSGDRILLVAEVTEREVDQNRVVATFNNKIGPHQIEDYLFFTRSKDQPTETIEQIQRYFAQGHELSFVVIQDWAEAVLVTIGNQGRTLFIQRMVDLLESDDVPAALKVAWNESVNAVVNQ